MACLLFVNIMCHANKAGAHQRRSPYICICLTSCEHRLSFWSSYNSTHFGRRYLFHKMYGDVHRCRGSYCSTQSIRGKVRDNTCNHLQLDPFIHPAIPMFCFIVMCRYHTPLIFTESNLQWRNKRWRTIIAHASANIVIGAVPTLPY